MSTPLLAIRDLAVEFRTPAGVVHAVDHVSYDVHSGEVVGVVGESGCGKTVTALSILGLVAAPPGRIVAGKILFEGRDLLAASRRELQRLRGNDISMVFQDPQSSLNPVFTIGQQIVAVLQAHDRRLSTRAARGRTLELLEKVGITGAASRVDDYPHQWSGGMCQRAMIAMAIANQPKLLIADEPTTALDVTIQAQVLDVLRDAQRDTGAATILITHDLGVVAEMADRVVVMYAGRVVESGPVDRIFHTPRHPYTFGLMASLPRLGAEVERLEPIPGQPPSLVRPPSGCSFHPRCWLRQGRRRCTEDNPPLVGVGTESNRAACHYSDEMPARIADGAASARFGVGTGRR
ncbi:MAG: ABC transporter ATP-binding protein [Actinomycetota bacterium]|nr:ABC transporter ATP-binding protein [Actinomycetota bacterium]